MIDALPTNAKDIQPYINLWGAVIKQAREDYVHGLPAAWQHLAGTYGPSVTERWLRESPVNRKLFHACGVNVEAVIRAWRDERRMGGRDPR